LKDPADTGPAEKGKRVIKRAAPVAMEVKLLAMEALEAGIAAQRRAPDCRARIRIARRSQRKKVTGFAVAARMRNAER
jgi:hypothetical protein